METTVYQEVISDDIADLLKKKIDIEALEPPDKDPLAFTISLGKCLRNHAPALSQKIKEAADKDTSVIHIKNFAKESSHPSYPFDGVVQFEGAKRTIANIHKVIGAMGMVPVLYTPEENTTLRSVAARINSEYENSSQSPYYNLGWHVDMAYRPINTHDTHMSPMPDYLIFGVALKGTPYLPITFIAIEKLIAELTPAELEAGLAEEYEVSSPDSLKKPIKIQNQPLLMLNEKGQYYNRINLQKSRALTERAQQFLDRVKAITDNKELVEYIHFEEGSIIALNNKNTIHMRAPYSPNWNGLDRYLIRVYAVRNLDAGISLTPQKRWQWE